MPRLLDPASHQYEPESKAVGSPGQLHKHIKSNSFERFETSKFRDTGLLRCEGVKQVFEAVDYCERKVTIPLEADSSHGVH